jgi:nitrite reductase/ring-hydroxylating ferredoxin subunit
MVPIPRKLKFCKIEELEESTQITKWVDEWKDEISAYWMEGEIVVLSTICPHFGGEFERISGARRLRCKWHGLEFNLNSGKCLNARISKSLSHYPWSKNDGCLEIILPEGFIG